MLLGYYCNNKLVFCTVCYTVLQYVKLTLTNHCLYVLILVLLYNFSYFHDYIENFD